jgi:hypothetical protein
MSDNFFGNAPNHAMPYDSVTYNGGTVPVTAGYHLVKRGSYGSIDFNTDKCVVDFDAGCTFTNIEISGDQIVLNFGPKTTLLANVGGGTLAITGDRNYVYFGPDSSIKDNGVPNARNDQPDGNGMAVSVRGKYNTVEAANWTTLFEGPHSAAAAYKNDGSAIHNTFKYLKGRNNANNGSYVSTASFHASAPHTTFYNCLSDYASPGATNAENAGGYKHGSFKLGPIAGTGSPSNGNGNGYGSKVLYCYADMSGNSPYGSSSNLPTGSSSNNNFGVINYGAQHSQVIGTYLDSDGETASLGMYEPSTLIYGCIWDSPSNMQQETTGTCVASIFKDPSNSNGTQENNIAVGGSIIALTND